MSRRLADAEMARLVNLEPGCDSIEQLPAAGRAADSWDQRCGNTASMRGPAVDQKTL